MKCPKCHKEVERGSLYCPNCLTEIPWVKEYDSVETQLEKKRQTMEAEQETGKLTQLGERLRVNKKRILFFTVLGAVFIGSFCYRQLHTFSALYTKAEKYYGRGAYDRAMRAVEEALEKEPGNLSANLLFASLLKQEGDAESAILVLQPMVKEYPDSVEAASMLVEYLAAEHRTGEIRIFLKNVTNPEILDACRDYICEKPSLSIESGIYTSPQTLELFADYDKIYYTLDGSMPNQNSTLYAGPIAIGEGTTKLNAFGINKNNISSDILSAEYVIVLKSPDKPKITPEAGIYRKKTKIKIEVPDGCRAYYAFDNENPTTASTEYKTPVNLPQGSHTFYAILVAPNGKISPVASCKYYLEY